MVSNAFMQLLGKEHADITYLKDEKISLVLSKALAETFRAKPNDPKQYFAKYLLNHSAQQKAAHKRQQRDAEIGNARKGHAEKIAEQSKKAQEDKAKLLIEAKQKEDFFNKLEESHDLHDNLEELANFLAENTGATGVYIGKLVAPLKQIEEDAGENDHLDEEAQKVIRYQYANKGHQFVIDRCLPPDQGITHDVFKESSQAPVEDEEAVEGAEATAKSGMQKDILLTFKHVYVPEVVREPRMTFQKVPRLGAYMAVPLIYQSCLFDEALDLAVVDKMEVMQKEEAIQKEMQEYYEGFNQRKEAALSAGEPFDEEERQFERFESQPFKVIEEKFVVGLDTLGQDRQFTVEQKRFVLDTVQRFRIIWEKQEITSLAMDRDTKIGLMTSDKQADTENLQAVMEEIEKKVEDMVFNREDLQHDEDLKDIVSKSSRLTHQAHAFIEKAEWKQQLGRISQMQVVKMPKIVQSLLYLLGFTREEVCEPKTNSIFWKKAKVFVHEVMPQRMATYQVLGEKQEVFKAYQTLNFCEKVLTAYTEEDVTTYHPGFFKLFKWLKMAVEARKANIIRRKALTKRAKADRAKKEEDADIRKHNREQFLIEAVDKFNEDHKEEIQAFEEYQEEQRKKNNEEYGEEQGSNQDEDEDKEPPVMPVFNEKEYADKFDEENPEMVIPAVVADEVHNDWVLTEEEEAKLIDDYWMGKEQ